MRIAVYPGGFDPVTNGHLDLVTRMTHLFDRVVVAVVKGRDKGSLFTWDERIELVRQAVDGRPNIEVEGFDGLMVEYAQRKRRGGGRSRHPCSERLRSRVRYGDDEPQDGAEY